MKKNFLIGCCFLLSCFISYSQHSLKAGFDGKEYRDILRIAFGITDTSAQKMKIENQRTYKMVYRSESGALDNRWDLWADENRKIAVINIRGTINTKESWLANFYAAMVPATGSIQVNDSTTFNYKMAKDSNAAVHVGWMIGLSYLGPDIIAHIKEYYAKGFKDFIISGHSQGGVLSLLMRSYVEYNGDLPKDIQFKTYASAAPKPGNLYYAYDLEYLSGLDWTFRVVNILDWVPETPFSIQTLDDFNQPNGLAAFKPAIKKQKLVARWYLNSAYKKLDKSPKKAVMYQQKYLGHRLYTIVKKTLPQLKEPAYSKGNNYMVAGTPVILRPDEKYKELFPFDGKNTFINHMMKPYLYLAQLCYP
ncbi:lipase family protein [Chitinophagaceae bacterium 26-R-25]|nr:lipase family protein [Chitinophagaceae bacterium 26-R-25]